MNLSCIKCEEVLSNIGGDQWIQPNDGLVFDSHGHYGSTFFDPMDGSKIQIVVCDKCLRDYFKVDAI